MPWYVYDKNIQLNEVYVCQGEFNDLLMSSGLYMESMNWINKNNNPSKLNCLIQVRHRGKATECEATFNKGAVEVHFKKAIRAIAPGQSAVLYENKRCLGGGIITKSIKL